MFPLVLSLEVATLATLLSCVVGVPLAALLGRTFRGRHALDTLVTLPLVLPPTVLGYYALGVFGRSSPLGKIFEELFGFPIVFTKMGAVIAASIGALPIIVRMGSTAFSGVSEELIWAARTLGASPFRAFVSIRLPLASRGIVAALMLSFARALGDFGLTLMIAGNIPGETQTASLAIYDALQAGDEGRARSMAIVLTIVAAAILYTVGVLTERHRDREH